MKKILCLIDGLGAGGAERQIVGLATMLKQKGYIVELVAYNNDDFYVSLAKQGGIEPLFIHTINNKLYKLLAIRHYIKKRGGYDWVVSFKNGPNAIACLLKFLGMKFNLIVSERIADSVVGRKNLLFRLYRYADFIVPNSYSQFSFLSYNYTWMKNKIVPITNFTDTDYFIPNFTFRSGPIKVLTVARIARQKNVIKYLEAINLIRKRGVKNVHFDWYGHVEKGQEDYAKECYDRLRQLSIDRLIEFHPATTDILEKYQQCDIFCLPSLYEGFPNVICEAMSCGKPIVCSRVCDNERIVSEGENGFLFDPNNPEEMADRLLSMISKREEDLLKCGEHSRQLALDLFSKKAFVNKYINLIESDFQL